MIDVLQDMPAGVAGIRVSGKVTGDDISQFKPEMEKLLGAEEVRIVEVIDPDYEGFGRGGLDGARRTRSVRHRGPRARQGVGRRLIKIMYLQHSA